MSVVTRDEVKTYLQITVATYDTLIDELIPQAEGLFLQKRGIPFFTFIGTTTAASAIINEIEDDNDFEYIKKIKIIENETLGIREKITLVEQDDEQITVENVIASTNEDVTFTIYPYGAQLATAKIIGYLMNKDSGNGYKSESIGNYRYDKFDSYTGLPVDIVSNIERYQTVWP